MPTMIRLIYRGRVGGQERERERERGMLLCFSFYTSASAPSDRLSPILLCSFGARLIPLYLISSSFSLPFSLSLHTSLLLLQQTSCLEF